MHEAKGSFNGYFRSPHGNKDQFTLRQADDQSDADFVARVRAFTNLLAEIGWTEWSFPLANSEGIHRANSSGYSDESGVTANGSQKATDAPARTGNSFEVESIKLAAGGEHPRWVVRGGNFLKYGVTCWPETLEAAGIAAKLDPLKDNQPTGTWIAHYNERQNDEGRWVPDKVTRLERLEA